MERQECSVVLTKWRTRPGQRQLLSLVLSKANEINLYRAPVFGI